ncbi:MAG: DUF1893 domain-containing protein [Muribaculaceae bacterium]|nr:DUF1893 domain-containing protein [Muribaculaceae bacterium]
MTPQERLRLIERHASGNISLLVAGTEEVHEFTGRGVKDLYQLYCRKPESLTGSFVVDKVVGKGAAALMALSHINSLHTKVISRQALELLQRSSIHVTYCELVDNIINRAGNGICPLESMCSECRTPEECLPLIETFMSRQNKTTQ